MITELLNRLKDKKVETNRRDKKRKKKGRETRRETRREGQRQAEVKKGGRGTEKERGREKKREIERDEVTWARCRVPKEILPYILYIQPLPDSI